jgi:hypothetical protein
MAATALVALALAIAVARPAPRVGGAGTGRLLVVLDSSWSMAARTSGGGTRWQRAIAGARSLVQSSGSRDIALATTADGLVEGPTSDIALIDTALGRLEPAGGENGAWPAVDDVAETHFFTDGAVERPLDPGVVVHSVFEPAPNVAITAFVARPATVSGTQAEAYLEVANYAGVAQSVRVVVTRDAAVVFDRDIPIGAGDALRQVLPLGGPGGARLGARVTAPSNALDVDDAAVAWLATADPVNVVVVSQAPGALVDLLKRDPNVRATFVRPEDYRAGEADVTVFDRWAPADEPRRPALYLAPPAVPWLATVSSEESAPRWVASSSHPVLDGVDPFSLEIARVRAYRSGRITPIALSEKGTPLVSVIDSPTARAVIVGFAVSESNLAATPAFPVFIGNAFEWLAHPASGQPRIPGPMELPASTTSVTDPDGRPVPIVRVGDRALVDLRHPGLYLVDAGGSRRVVGVNIGRPAIANAMHSSIVAAPAPTLAFRVSARPWWMYGVFAALILITLEWLTWQQRITV